MNVSEGFDPTDTEALKELFTSGALLPEHTPEQQRALDRLETTLALIEGWVDHVTTLATTRLPKASSLGEAIRRRRASGGPAERAFSTLVGLELRPRRLRDASALWAALTEGVGPEARDALWQHPDSLPTDADLDNPAELIERLTHPNTAPMTWIRPSRTSLTARPIPRLCREGNGVPGFWPRSVHAQPHFAPRSTSSHRLAKPGFCADWSITTAMRGARH